MTSSHVQTLANSIIGTAILAMPYCFAKCGVILSIFLLVVSTIITRSCCHYLIKASIVTRRRTMEQLGFHMFGPAGKTMVEISVIGFLMGTCVAFFVVIGDLSPQIVSKIFNLKGFSHDSVRNFLIVLITLTVVVPLCFQKSIESLAMVCKASIGFYICLTLKTVFESFEKFETDENWSSKIDLWKSAGVLQCIPIFSMSMSCQMQLFEVYESMPGSFDRIKRTVHQATLMCCIVYCVVGFFGYLAFYNQTLSGNVLMNFSPSFANDAITFGFILSIACSFPLVIFPCRTSLASFLHRKSHHAEIAAYVPESKYQPLTLFIIFSTMVLGILIPSVEVIISLVGSTIGILVCVIFPATCFVKIMKRNSLEKTFAQLIIVGGFIIMVLGTYANLVAMETAKSVEIGQFQVENRIDEVKLPVELPLVGLNDGDGGAKETKVEDIKSKEELEKIIKEVKKSNEIDEKSIKVDKKLNEDGKKSKEIDKKSKEIDKNAKENDKKILENDKKLNENDKKSNENDKNIPEVEVKLPDEVIKKEEQEIAVEKTKDPQVEIKEKNEEIEELKETKNKLEKEVQEMKEVLVKQNKETQDLVLQKFEEIAEKVDKIEKQSGDNTKEKEVKEEKEKLKEEVKAAAEVVKASLEEKAQEVVEKAEKIEEKASDFGEKIAEIGDKVKNARDESKVEDDLKNSQAKIENNEGKIENNQGKIENIKENDKKIEYNLKKSQEIPQENVKEASKSKETQNNHKYIEKTQEAVKSHPDTNQQPFPTSNSSNIVNPPQNSDLNLLEVENPQNIKNLPSNPETRVDPIVKLIKSQEPLSYQVGEKMTENKKVNATVQENGKIKPESVEIKNEMRRKRETDDDIFEKTLDSLDKKITNFEIQSILTRDLKATNEN